MAGTEDAWRGRLPQDHGMLLGGGCRDQDAATLLGLLAVCVARTVNGGGRTWTTPEGSRCIAAQVAGAAGLDMRQCWTPTKESYLEQVPKALILDAVRGVGVPLRGRTLLRFASRTAHRCLRRAGDHSCHAPLHLAPCRRERAVEATPKRHATNVGQRREGNVRRFRRL